MRGHPSPSKNVIGNRLAREEKRRTQELKTFKEEVLNDPAKILAYLEGAKFNSPGEHFVTITSKPFRYLTPEYEASIEAGIKADPEKTLKILQNRVKQEPYLRSELQKGITAADEALRNKPSAVHDVMGSARKKLKKIFGKN